MALTVAIPILAAGCYRLFFSPPTSRIEGWVYSTEDQEPLPGAEVCALGLDTTCVRADHEGHYSVRLAEQTVVFRFRYGALPPAASDSLRIAPPVNLTVNCGLSGRLVLSDRPVLCRPVPGH